MAAPAVAATSVSQLLRALVLATGLCACAVHAQEIPPPAYQL
ncbi:lytic transglycosylase domain-containing protein, partial [Pseudomonas aeruginosa]|nr:lytic transglycosylase domain-containing protein [Pseudomonas aeruginosa]